VLDPVARSLALVEAAQTLAASLERVPAPLLVVDSPAGLIRAMNAKARALLGHGPDALPMSAADVWHAPPADWAEGDRPDPRPVKTPWGEDRWITASVAPAAAPGLVVVALQDVTTYRSTHARLRHSERLLVEAQRVASSGAWEWNLQTDELTWSEGLYRLHGHDPATFTPTFASAAATFAPEQVAEARARLERMRENLDSFDYERWLVRADGERRYVRSCASVVHDDSGRPLRVVGMVADITERKRIEDALAEANAELARQARLMTTMMNAFPGAIAYCGPDYVHRAANDAAAARYGLPDAGALIGRRAAEFFPEAQSHVAALADQAMATGRPVASYGDELKLQTPDGPETRCRDYLVAPVEPALGGGFVVVSLDATERMALERLVRRQVEELQRADRYKDEFLSVISHELRTPLNFIMGFASVLEDELYGPINEKQQGAVGRILKGADKMLALVNDLLEFATFTSGHLRLAPAPADYRAVVAEAVGALAPLAERGRLALDWAVAPMGPVTLDAHRVGQVFLNLLSNALKFTPPGGRVSVTAFRRGDALVTEVTDTGCGIAEADLPRLFRRFGQLDMSATRAHGGAGLGLAISKAIVEAHGGTVFVRSEPGVGSTFGFTLPIGVEGTLSGA
jgi:PAS domain S-box-containing protein